MVTVAIIFNVKDGLEEPVLTPSSKPFWGHGLSKERLRSSTDPDPTPLQLQAPAAIFISLGIVSTPVKKG